MANKDHNEYMSFFKNIASLTTIDIPNQPNSIKGEKSLRINLIVSQILIIKKVLKQQLSQFP